MAIISLNPPKMTDEDLCVAMVRREYLEGRISVDEFEDQIESALKGDLPAYLGLATSGEWR